MVLGRELRRKVQGFTADALGSMTEENRRMINLSVYGNSFMIFKNWIPRPVDVRTGNLKFNAASDMNMNGGEWEWWPRIITEDFLGALGHFKKYSYSQW